MKAWVRQKKADVRRVGRNKAPWYVHWKKPDGSRRARCCGVGAKAKQSATTLAAQIHAELLAGTYKGDPTLILWSAFIAEYKKVHLRTKSGSHVASVRRSIEVFTEHMNPRSLAQVTTKFIQQFIVKRSMDRGQKPGSVLSAASVNKDLRNLKLVLTVAVEWKQLKNMPKIQMLREPKRLKRYVTTEHFAAMLVAADTMISPNLPNVSAPDYWKALLSFAFVTGWRLNEILNVRREDVNFDTGQVVARWDDSKGKRDESIFIPEAVVDLLRPVWRSFGDRPMNWPKAIRGIYSDFLTLQQSAGIHLVCEDGSHEHTKFCHVYGFHDFKRAFATNNAASLNPAQLQRLMKHSDFSTTQGYINYAKVMTERPDVFVPDVLKKKG